MLTVISLGIRVVLAYVLSRVSVWSVFGGQFRSVGLSRMRSAFVFIYLSLTDNIL